MTFIDKFLRGFRSEDDGETGILYRREDGSCWYRKPDSSEAEIGGGSGPLQSASVVLTDAQVKALPTTPAVLVSDPGSGRFVILQSAFFRVAPADYVPYTNIDAAAQLFLGDLGPVFDETTNSAVSGLLSDSGSGNALATAEQITITFGGPNGLTRPNWGWGDSDLSGPFRLTANNGASGNFTGGGAGNSLQIAVSYYVFDTEAGAFELA